MTDAAAGSSCLDTREVIGVDTKYEVHQRVGRGKFSIVHCGRRIRDGVVVALKFVDLSSSVDKRIRERTLQEIRLYQTLNHPHIIKYLDSFIDDKSRLVIVLEWAGFGDLKRQLSQIRDKGNQLPERTIWRSYLQICSALSFMHENRVLHRDLKPANIFLMKDGRLKIGDLGLSRMLSESSPEAFSTVGTPHYMSPEAIRGEGYDYKSDVWSMGCILYEMAMLRPPFKDGPHMKIVDLFQKIVKGAFPPVSTERDPDLQALPVRMLNLDPAQRPTMAEVCQVAMTRVGVIQNKQPPSTPKQSTPHQAQPQQPASAPSTPQPSAFQDATRKEAPLHQMTPDKAPCKHPIVVTPNDPPAGSSSRGSGGGLNSHLSDNCSQDRSMSPTVPMADVVPTSVSQAPSSLTLTPLRAPGGNAGTVMAMDSPAGAGVRGDHRLRNFRAALDRQGLSGRERALMEQAFLLGIQQRSGGGGNASDTSSMAGSASNASTSPHESGSFSMSSFDEQPARKRPAHRHVGYGAVPALSSGPRPFGQSGFCNGRQATSSKTLVFDESAACPPRTQLQGAESYQAQAMGQEGCSEPCDVGDSCTGMQGGVRSSFSDAGRCTPYTSGCDEGGGVDGCGTLSDDEGGDDNSDNSDCVSSGLGGVDNIEETIEPRHEHEGGTRAAFDGCATGPLTPTRRRVRAQRRKSKPSSLNCTSPAVLVANPGNTPQTRQHAEQVQQQRWGSERPPRARQARRSRAKSENKGGRQQMMTEEAAAACVDEFAHVRRNSRSNKRSRAQARSRRSRASSSSTPHSSSTSFHMSGVGKTGSDADCSATAVDSSECESGSLMFSRRVPQSLPATPDLSRGMNHLEIRSSFVPKMTLGGTVTSAGGDGDSKYSADQLQAYPDSDASQHSFRGVHERLFGAVDVSAPGGATRGGIPLGVVPHRFGDSGTHSGSKLLSALDCASGLREPLGDQRTAPQFLGLQNSASEYSSILDSSQASQESSRGCGASGASSSHEAGNPCWRRPPPDIPLKRANSLRALSSSNSASPSLHVPPSLLNTPATRCASPLLPIDRLQLTPLPSPMSSTMLGPLKPLRSSLALSSSAPVLHAASSHTTTQGNPIAL